MKQDKDQGEYYEMMEKKTNKIAKEIVQLAYKNKLDPFASIFSIVKASAMIIEAYGTMGENADGLEELIKNTIGPTRLELREIMKKKPLKEVLES